jgi:hypothetical protein
LSRYLVFRVLASLMMPAAPLVSQEPHVSTQAPRDKPVAVASDEQKRRFDAAIAPYVAEARGTYSSAKRRYLAGLPPQQSFFVTVELQDAAGRREVTFLAVDSLARDSIFGRIWNEIHVVRGYRLRDKYAVREAELLDWLITKPDGSEEGNAVGKFLDTYRP